MDPYRRRIECRRLASVYRRLAKAYTEQARIADRIACLELQAGAKPRSLTDRTYGEEACDKWEEARAVNY